MSLDNFIKTKKKRQVSLKAAIRIMRSKFFEGNVSRFDEKLSSIFGCSLDYAEVIRNHWVECGLLGINRRGLLCWRNRSF